MQRYCSVPDTLIHWYHHHLEARQLDFSDLFGQATIRPVLRLLKAKPHRVEDIKPFQTLANMFLIISRPRLRRKWGLEIERY